MKTRKSLPSIITIVFVVACFSVSALAQSSDQLATPNSTGSSVRWDIKATPHSAATLTVIGPDGESFSKEFQGGNSPEFRTTNKAGERLPDGTYTYELRLTPVFAAGVREALKAAREAGNERAVVRELKRRGQLPTQPLVQSGSFAILNGTIIVAGGTEGTPFRAKVEQPAAPATPVVSAAPSGRVNYKVRRHHPAFFAFDQVIPDDLIVQMSLCVGFDCVDGESFGTDTIRMKENNTRLQFDDTSVSAGFPTNNWQIRANDQSGGGSFLGIVDQGAGGAGETGTIVMAVDAGALANSLRVASNSKVGFRTATPSLDMHANTSDTPAIRLEQNNTGGFSAQTWDIGANEANFFVRDLTGGSRLSFRIRPGAPTSSIDIAASGNVGINTASPTSTLDVSGNLLTVGSDSGATSRTNLTTKLSRLALPPFNTSNLTFGVLNAATTASENLVGIGGGASGMSASTSIQFITAANNNTDTGTERMRVTSDGRVGIGTTAPDQLLSVNGNASKALGGGSWLTFSDRRLKNIKSPFTTGLNALMQLQPVRFQYRSNNEVGLKSEGEYVGFAAQDVQKVIPEAVNASSKGYLMVNNDPIIWTMLNAIKEQQKEIVELKRQIRQLRSARRRK